MQFEYKLLIFISACVITGVIIFFTVIYQSPIITVSELKEDEDEPEIPSLLKYCNDSVVDRLSTMSRGKFSCCRDNQICDKKWWTDYAPTIDGGETTIDGQLTPLGYIIELVNQGGVTGNFLGNKGVREEAHSVVAEEICKDTCASFRQGTYVTNTAKDDKAMGKLEKILGFTGTNNQLIDQLALKDGIHTNIHTGKCVDACNKSTGCKNFIFVNHRDKNNSNENGLCLMVRDDQVKKIINEFNMKEIGDDSTIGIDNEKIFSIFTGGDFQLS